MWARTMSRLAPIGYQAWAVDLIGFGESDQPGHGWYTLDRFTETLARFCDQMSIDRPALIGHSMGGAIALNLALARKARALVLAAPVINGALTFSLHLLLTSPAARRLYGWMREQTFFPALGGMRLAAAPMLIRDPARRRMHQDFRRTTVNAAVGSLRAVVTSNLADRIGAIDAPTLVVVGRRDKVVSPDQGRLAARRIRGSTLIMWPDAGHQLIDDYGDEFDTLVIEHLREKTSEVFRSSAV
jgi:pimeloyl-ACP methyl ester carboxylesterase